MKIDHTGSLEHPDFGPPANPAAVGGERYCGRCSRWAREKDFSAAVQYLYTGS